MKEIQSGKITLFGVVSNGSPLTITGIAGIGFVLDSIPITHVFESDAVRQEQKFTVNLTATDEAIEIEIDMVLTQAGVTLIKDAFNVVAGGTTRTNIYSVFPAPLARLTLSNWALTIYNGKWTYIGGAKLESSAGMPAKFTGMKLRKYADTTQNNLFDTIVAADASGKTKSIPPDGIGIPSAKPSASARASDKTKTEHKPTHQTTPGRKSSASHPHHDLTQSSSEAHNADTNGNGNLNPTPRQAALEPV
jgi:hypothetical protein